MSKAVARSDEPSKEQRMAKRGTLLTVYAVLFGILAVSNMSKGLQIGSTTGFVFFGARLSGIPNAILGLVFGALLAVYAYGIWNMKRFVLPVAHLYATYVILNLALFTFRGPMGELPVVFMAVYSLIAVGVSVSSAVILTQRKNELS
jgi:hypothetical protein